MWVDLGVRQAILYDEMMRLVGHPLQGAFHWQGQAEWSNLIREYTAASQVDFQAICQSMFALSRPVPAIDAGSAVSYQLLSTNQVEAYTDMASDGEARISMSQGLFLALEDVLSRLVSLEGFADGPSENGRVRAVPLSRESLVVGNDEQVRPTLRYMDYDPLLIAGDVDGRDTALSGFFTAIPVSEERVHLAQLMLRISLLWVMLHEESHHLLGHLHWVDDRLGIAGDEIRIDEIGPPVTGVPHLMSKVLEWQADRDATRGVIDVVMRNSVLNELPQRFRSAQWLLRFILTAIGCTIAIFDKARIIHRSSGVHPSPRTRLLAAAATLQGYVPSPRLGAAELSLPPTSVREVSAAALTDIALVCTVVPDETVTVYSADVPEFRPDHLLEWMLATDNDLVAADLAVRLIGLGVPDLKEFGRELIPGIVENLNRELTSGPSEKEFRTAVRPRSIEDAYHAWVAELPALVSAHDEYVWNLLAPYRRYREGTDHGRHRPPSGP
ncbi:hypothetical protein [Nonomuraea typhae]|uniref:hypothetical protein n=1 Tax=Nonomuraea typhae TaxID=2603600 RepID=UPI0012FB0D48|nr:hypothetical protein [Nonomuraea typhae]